MAEQGIINGVETERPPERAKASQTVTGEAQAPKDRTPAETKKFHPLLELTLARVREFLREPEVVFWVFVFPLLLVFALGIAFRNTGPQKIRIAVEKSETNASASSTIADALSRSKEIEAVQ